MDLIFEIIMEVLVEGLLEGFVALAQNFFPEKTISVKVRKVLSVCLILLAVVLASGLFVGVCLLLESAGRSVLGWALVGAAAAYLVLGIGLNIYAAVKKEKKGTEL